MSSMLPTDGATSSGLSRRSLAAGVAWTVPALAVASAAPAYAVSGCTPDLTISQTPITNVRQQAGPWGSGDNPYRVRDAGMYLVVQLTELLGCNACKPRIQFTMPLGFDVLLPADLTEIQQLFSTQTFPLTNPDWSIKSTSTDASGVDVGTMGYTGCVPPNGTVNVAVQLVLEPHDEAFPPQIGEMVTQIVNDPNSPRMYDSDTSNNVFYVLGPENTSYSSVVVHG